MYIEFIIIVVFIIVLLITAKTINLERKKLGATIAPIGGLLLFVIFFHKLLLKSLNELNLVVIIPSILIVFYFIFRIYLVIVKKKINGESLTQK